MESLIALLPGIAATLAVYVLGCRIYARTRLAVLTPNIFSMGVLILGIVLLDIPYEQYGQGGEFLSQFLRPLIVVLALPLHRRLPHLLQHKMPVLAGIVAGVLVSSALVVGAGTLLGFDTRTIVSLLPKSVTIPMGLEAMRSMDGLVPLAVLAITLTGITGVVTAPAVVRILRITHPVARGVAIGTSSHVLGTTKALEMGETEGAISSLSLILAGLLSVFYLPLVAFLLQR